MNIRDVQTALKREGFDPGEIDGAWGPNTAKAVKAFQASEGLEADGIVGSKTIKALGLSDTNGPQWVAEARRYLGMHEVRDAKQLDDLLDMDTSEIPWCGGFVGLVFRNAMPDQSLPANMLWARNWMKFGEPIDRPAVGAVAVFGRGEGGHVGIVVGHDANSLHILGGNQSNRVSVAKIAKSRLLGYRWPKGHPKPIGDLPMTTLAGTLSKNEA